MKSAIIFHNDNDGKCSAAIAYRYLGSKSLLLATNYDKPAPFEYLKDVTDLWIVDFSYPPEVMREILKVVQCVTWIDHHKTAKSYDYGIELPGIRNFNDKEFAACELTWQYCYPEKKAPLAVDYIGKHDRWDFQDGDPCEIFQAGTCIQDLWPGNSIWDEFFEDDRSVEGIINDGYIIQRYREMVNNGMRRDGYTGTWNGYHCFIVPNARSSKVFGDKINQFDLCLGYEYTGSHWIMHVYSAVHDCGEICKQYGGGGHKGAAGFVSDEFVFPHNTRKR